MARRPADRHRVRAARAVHRGRRRTSSASACWPTSSTCRCTCTLHETAQEVEDSAREHGQRPLARHASAGPGQRSPDRRAHDPADRRRDRPVRRARRLGRALPRIEPQARLAASARPRTAARRREPRASAPTAAPATTTSTCSARCAPRRCWRRRSPTMRPRSTRPARCARRRWAARKALGWDERIGSIEAGKQADLVCVRRRAIETQPMYNVISQLVYADGPPPGQRRLDRRQPQAASSAS